MWFRLNLEVIDFHFRISKYRKSTVEKWDKEWCKIDLTLQAPDWLNYQIVSAETMLAVEVEVLRDKINDLLHDKLSEPEKRECIEPDFVFHLHPKNDILNNPDIDMDFQVTFWDRDGALSCNRLMLMFIREDLEMLLCYFQYITGIVDDEDEMVQRLLSEGYLYV